MRKPNKRLGLYLHIPFCIKKCKYCDFLSAPATKAVRTAYLEALTREMESKGNHLFDEPNHEVRTLYVGGGTPSLLDASEMKRLIAKCKEAFRIRDDRLLEFTIEANPGTLEKEKLEAYRALGVDRISFGLQSVHNDELMQLGRMHRYEDFSRNYEWAREVGFTNVNVDLMTGLPNQTLKRLRESLNVVCGLQPEHVSVYGLILEPGTDFYQLYGETPPVEEEVELEMYRVTKETLEDGGYRQYEISNFAKEGYEALHNQAYWERVDYLGLGLGASSLINGVRWQNETDMDTYLTRSHPETSVCFNQHVLSRKEQMEEFMFLGLRMVRGVREADFAGTFGETMEAVYGSVMSKWEEGSYLIREEGNLRLSDKGRYVSNRILADFLLSE